MGSIDQDLTELMNGLLRVAQIAYPEIPENEMRCRIASANLKGMVEVILLADDPSNEVNINLKAICLGLLSAADFLDPEEVSDANPSDERTS